MSTTYKMPQLQKGSEGVAVAMLQGILTWRINGKTGKPFYTDKVDGEFGSNTYKAVYDYQKIMTDMGYDFLVDGICGDQTWNSLLAKLPRA